MQAALDPHQDPNEVQELCSSFHFLFHYPNITPIITPMYYSSFHTPNQSSGFVCFLKPPIMMSLATTLKDFREDPWEAVRHPATPL